MHRNGRTARAQRKGFALLMCAPDERRVVRAMLGSLGRRESLPCALDLVQSRVADVGCVEEDELLEMPVDLHMLDKLKARIQVARKIDNAQHKVQKQTHERNWLRETADAMEIELDSDFAR